MAKGYEDLSRRALIQLGKDYDSSHNGELLQFLSDHSSEYEDIRFIEKVVEKADVFASNVKRSKNAIKEVMVKEGGNVLNTVVDTINAVRSLT